MCRCKNEIAWFDVTQCKNYLSQLEEKWYLTHGGLTNKKLNRLGFKQFFRTRELDEDGLPRYIDDDLVYISYDATVENLHDLRTRFKQIQAYTTDVRERWRRLREQVRDAKNNVMIQSRARQRV
jgi:hypothetical protein